ncbi:cadmium resistance transporter [Streptomyces sp. NPDC059718]
MRSGQAAGLFAVTFLPESAVPYLGLLRLALGLKAAWQAWKHRDDDDGDQQASEAGPKALEVAAVTFANGGDNIGVYVPVFATAYGEAPATAAVGAGAVEEAEAADYGR